MHNKHVIWTDWINQGIDHYLPTCSIVLLVNVNWMFWTPQWWHLQYRISWKFLGGSMIIAISIQPKLWQKTIRRTWKTRLYLNPIFWCLQPSLLYAVDIHLMVWCCSQGLTWMEIKNEERKWRWRLKEGEWVREERRRKVTKIWWWKP